MFVRVCDAVQRFPAEFFVRRYAVTPAACRLLMLLVQGMTIAEAADTLGVALCTAKTHLAGLIRQDRREAPADLVRIAMGAPRRGSEPRMTWQLPHCQTPELSISIVYVKFSAQGLTMTIASPNASTAEAGHDHVHVFVEAMKL